MTRRKIIFLFILTVLIGGGVYIIFSDSYPVAWVDGQMIKARDFEKDYAAAVRYYQNILKLYAKNQTQLDSAEAKQEIRRATLEKLIEDKLINAYLKKSIKTNELKKLVDGKIEAALKGADIQKGVQELYGFSLDDFKQKVLSPQAEREILEGRLFFENKKLDEWLKDAKKQTKVVILSPDFGWENGKVTTRKITTK